VTPLRAAGFDLAFEPLELRLRRPWTIARGTSTAKRNGLLRVAAGGVEGFGEAAPNVRYQQSFDTAAAAFGRVREAVAGLDPWDHPGILVRAEAAAGADHELVAALDLALWDWRGKSLGAPVWKLLGLPRGPIPPTSYSIGIDDPQLLRSRVDEAAEFPILKIKLGGGADEATIRAVRDVTNKTLRADANEGWSGARDAEEKIAFLASAGVELVEQPLPAARDAETKQLFEHSKIPIYADESAMGARQLLGLLAAFHGVNIKIAKCGGLTRAHEMLVTARNLGFRVLLGCMIESSLGIAGALPLAALADEVDLDGNLLLAEDPFTGLERTGAAWRLTDRPGLGVERAPAPPPRHD
jgi:L-alanine-DL-glutamate epimerase-like enolase superfamily enzyme